MIYIGHTHMEGTSKKSGEKYDFYSLQAVVHSNRYVGLGVQTVNISPHEFKMNENKLKPGVQFRCFSEGGDTGIMVLALDPVDISCFADAL